jgi:hypothetical protein
MLNDYSLQLAPYSLGLLLPLFTNCREQKFSETDSQDRATLCARTGAMDRFAPVLTPQEQAPCYTLA